MRRTSSGFERIVYEKAPPRATITLNRPEVLNAFDFQMLREIARACEDASWDDEIRVVVAHGRGARRSASAPTCRSWADDYLGKPTEYWKWFGAFKDAHDRLREIGKPTLARINGIAVGGGNELQMACDLAVMVDDAFIRHVGPEHGSVPAGGATQWLTIMVGDRRAREIVLMCEELPGAQGRGGGSSTGPCPLPSSTRRSTQSSRTSRAKLPQTTRYAKQHLNFWRDLAWHETINHARDWLALSMATEEPRKARSSASSERRVSARRVERDGAIAVVAAQPARSAERALGRADGRARVESLQELDRRRGGPRDRARRLRARLRRRGRHRRARGRSSAIELYYQRRIERWDAIRGLWTPLVAAVSGYCLGGGCELAMACDLIVASETARVRPAGDRSRDHSRRRRHAAADAARSGRRWRWT